VDDSVGVDRREQVERLPGVGEFGRAESDGSAPRRLVAGMVAIHADDAVLSLQAIDEPATRPTQAAGDEDSFHGRPSWATEKTVVEVGSAVGVGDVDAVVGMSTQSSTTSTRSSPTGFISLNG
jgi:hypothetical protein